MIQLVNIGKILYTLLNIKSLPNKQNIILSSQQGIRTKMIVKAWFFGLLHAEAIGNRTGTMGNGSLQQERVARL